MTATKRDRGEYHRERAHEISMRLDAERKKRMHALKAKIKSHGTPQMNEALKVAELGYGWRAVQLASWGHLSDLDAKILTGFPTP